MKKSLILVGIIMGSKSDWPTMKETSMMLDKLKIPHESKIISAHRGAAHLPGMTASLTSLPVIGVPIKSRELQGLDSLLSINQMPKGIPVATVAIGKSGAINAALLAASILGNKYDKIRKELNKYRSKQTKTVLKNSNPRR